MELYCFFKLILWSITIEVLKFEEKQEWSFDELDERIGKEVRFDMWKVYGRSYACSLNEVNSECLLRESFWL